MRPSGLLRGAGSAYRTRARKNPLALAGWGNDNVFRDNRAEVNAAGFGFSVQRGATGNRISCTFNLVTGAAAGLSNVPCTSS